jgi:small-conductance mechanosensitive channel
MFEYLTRQNVMNIVTQLGIIMGIILVSVLLARIIRRLMSKKAEFGRVDKTVYKFLSHLISGLIYFIGIVLVLYSIPSLRGIAAPLFAGSGVLAIVIGFASQHALSNVVSGIFIAIFKPFRLGDRIKFLEKEFIGVVEDVTLRHTVIRTFDNRRIIVPNSVISSEVLVNENIVENKTVRFFDIGISYDSDVDKAMRIIKEEALKHPKMIDNRTDEEKADNEEIVKVRVIGFGESSVNLRGVIWTASPKDAYLLGCDMNKSVKERFDREGIEIPFPYRTIVYKQAKQTERRKRKKEDDSTNEKDN